MDLRERKTLRSIKNAFLQLRAHKALERITIKELTELAEISKATFYLHYKDIYDLSDQLQREVVQNILGEVLHEAVPLNSMAVLTHRLFQAFFANQSMIDILFSDSQAAVLPISIEQGVKEYFCRAKPELVESMEFHVILSFQIHGAYHAYAENHKQFGNEQVLEVLNRAAMSVPFPIEKV